MFLNKKLLWGLVVCLASSSICLANEEREWKDQTGNYTIKAELIAYSSKMVVLQRIGEDNKKELVSLEIKDLSADDKKFLQSIRSGEKRFAPPESTKTWTMKSGLRVKGRVVQFARREVVFQLADDRVYVNDKLFKNLPAVYQKMAPGIVSYFEKIKVEDEAGIKKFLANQTAGSKEYVVDGVLFELENGDRYGVPLFFFSQLDLAALNPSWQRWAAANASREQREKESFYLRAQSQAENDGSARMRQIAEIKLQLQAYDAGLFDLWEVQLITRFNGRVAVVVPGRNSDQAVQAALTKYPGNRVGSIKKIRRRR